jgi:hypothetical protein
MSVREPTHTPAPTGDYDVFSYDHAATTASLVLACGSDQGRAALAMRKTPGAACIARGGVVTSVKSGTPTSQIASMKAAVKAARGGAGVEAAPAVAEAPVANPSNCSKCSKYPVAATTERTHPGTESWCAHCRRVDAMRRNGSSPAHKTKAPKKASTRATKPTAAIAVNHPVAPESSAAVVEAPASDFAAKVRSELAQIGDMLIEKNKAYGNSALEPVRVFSRATPIEQLLVRIDDKLSRLARGSDAGEDVELDLVGYLVLLRIARRA